MSKKVGMNDEDYSYKNFWHNFNGSNYEDDDENDEDYCFLEDKIENFNKYKNDNIPYDFSIPKKEIYDVLNDPDNLFFLNEEDLNNSALSIRSKAKNKNNRDNVSNYNNLNNSHNYSELFPHSNLYANTKSNPIKNKSPSKRRKRKRITKNSSIRKNKENSNEKDKQNEEVTNTIEKNSSINNREKEKEFSQMNMNDPANASFSTNSFFQYKQAANPNLSNAFFPANPNPTPTAINQTIIGSTTLNQTINSVYLLDITEMIKLLLKQYDLFLQILIQNILLTDDQGIKYRCYTMLFSFYMTRQRVLQTAKLQDFGVNFNFTKIFNTSRELRIRPQISFFQAPILEIVPLVVKFMKKSFSKEELITILKEFFPLVNPHYLPVKFNCNTGTNNELGIRVNEVVNKSELNTINQSNTSNIVPNQRNSNEVNEASVQDGQDEAEQTESHPLKTENNFLGRKRKKFDSIHDQMLMLGLMHHGKKNIEIIQHLWVKSRSLQEIRHRIKNLTCKRAPENIIKKWKTLLESPLSKEEFLCFLKGIQWFGTKNRWSAISRYFLPNRTAEYIECLYENLVSNNIFKKDKENINTYISPTAEDNNICQINKSTKKKHNNSSRVDTPSTSLIILTHPSYLKEFDKEIKQTMEEILNFETKNKFYTPEQQFEKFELEETSQRGNVHPGSSNYISTRHKSNTNPFAYYNSLPKNMSQKWASGSNFPGRLPVFDFHIKKIDSSAYEKIEID